MARLKVTVEPKLPPDDRRALTAFIQTLKRNRNYVQRGCAFMYRGSLVKCGPVAPDHSYVPRVNP